MFFIPIKTVFLSVAAVIAFGFCVIQFTGLSSLLVNYPGISFVLGVLSFSAVLLVFGKNGAEQEQNSDTERQQQNDAVDNATLYIGNLQYRVNEKEVQSHFSQYGVVKSVRLMKDKRTGKRKGFGFVEVAKSDVAKMIDNLNDTTFHERTLKVRPAKEKVTG